MFDAQGKTQFNKAKVLAKARDGAFRSLGHAAAAIRLTAKRSIRRRKGAAAAGQPPNTHTRRLPQSIVYFVDKQSGRAIVGTAASIIGEGGKPHELGGQFRGQRYPKRPFMAPALQKMAPRLPAMWANSVSN